jgi:hypothetical protein
LEGVRKRMLEAGSDQDYEDPDNYSLCPATKAETRVVSEELDPALAQTMKSRADSDHDN